MFLVGEVCALGAAGPFRDEVEHVCEIALPDQRVFWKLDEGLAHDTNELELFLQFLVVWERIRQELVLLHDEPEQFDRDCTLYRGCEVVQRPLELLLEVQGLFRVLEE